MRSYLDLWSHDDVSAHVDAILARLEDGSMPCDRGWSPAKVGAFANGPKAAAPRNVDRRRLGPSVGQRQRVDPLAA